MMVIAGLRPAGVGALPQSQAPARPDDGCAFPFAVTLRDRLQAQVRHAQAEFP